MRPRQTPSLLRFTGILMLVSICVGSSIGNLNIAEAAKKPDATSKRKQPVLGTLPAYAINMTEQARRGVFAPSATHDVAVERALQLLGKSVEITPVLLDETGLRDLVMQKIALRLAMGEVSPALQGKQLWRVDNSALLCGAEDSSIVLDRLKGILSEARSGNGEHILYIDELTSLVHPAQDGDVAQLLRNALKDQDLRFITATKASDFEIAITNELSSHFKAISLNETSDNLATAFMR